MPELPNIVIRKLADRQLHPGASHPDADLLTAFVERALPDRERGTVLTHLAACAPCREIVALAQPAEIATSTVLAPKPSRSLFLLRWGALATCAALAISVAVLHERKSGETPLLAKNQTSAQMVEQKTEVPASTKAVFGKENNESKDDANKLATAALETPREQQRPEAPAVLARRFGAESVLGIDSKSKRRPEPLTRTPAPKYGSAGFLANDADSGSNIAGQNFNLPLKGRNVLKLPGLEPGVVGGAAAGAGASGTLQPSVPEANPERARANEENVAEKDKRSYALQKSATSANVFELAKARSKTPSVVAAEAHPAPDNRAGEIRGLVVDPSGAAVSGAKVTLTNTATGASLASFTNPTGIYDVSSVPAGPYMIAISKPGFQEFIRPGFNLEPTTLAVNATLQIGAVSETVAVEAQAAAIDATSSSTTPYAPTDKDEFRASSAQMADLPDLTTARQAGTWQITVDGKLQRSLDGGKSWESVAVDPSGRLRVVTATGFQVWAGGNGGVLLHSRDAGDHFTNVKVHQKRSTLKGDIVTLTFPDAQHGRVETADHDVWTTNDGGKTWQPSAAVK